ncbi:MAG: HEAT repeat domain-containing protein [Terracidiphilus sp.]
MTTTHRLLKHVLLGAAAFLAAASASAETHPGDQSRWSLDFRTCLEQRSATPVEVHMAGEWTSTIAAVRTGQYDAQLQLSELHFSGDAAKNASAAALAGLEARLSRPFWATYRSDGGLLAIHFLRDMSPSDRNLLQMVATELQLVRPGAARASWTAQERDGAGEYSALYLMPRPDRILKRKLKYVYTDGVAGVPTDAVHVSIDRSEIAFSLAGGLQVQGVDGIDRVNMDLTPDEAQQLTAATEFHLSNLRTGRAPELVGSLDRARTRISSSAILTQRPDAAVVRIEADVRLLKGSSTAALLAAAFAKDAGSAASPDRLAALFRCRPEAASAAVDLLVKEGATRKVTNALGAAGSLSAVSALNDLAHNAALDEKLRVDAIVAFVQMQHPMVEAMRVLEDLMNDPDANIQSAARMISGALSRAGRVEHAPEADAIDASLIALFRSAQDTREKTELLGALGNSAGPSTVPVIEEALHDPTAAIRAAAARALRLAPGPEVDRLLADAIASDPDGVVRSDAIFATRFRHPLSACLADALMQAASADTARFVRSNAIAVLRQNPTASPQIPETLKRIAQLDADAAIRRQAGEALEALSAVATTHP